MSGYNYSTYTAAVATMVAEDPANADFVSIIPRMIEYAEARIYRDLDLLGAVVQDSSTSLAAGTRLVTVPTNAAGRYRVIDGINLIISSTRTPLIPVGLQVLDNLWPSATAPSTTAMPSYFAMVTDYQIALGPTLGASAGTATLEFNGRVTPTALNSTTNTTTYLSTYFPELLLAASMIFMSGYTKNFGAQADNPQMAMSWEQQYSSLLTSANAQEARRKFASASWSSAPAEPAATAQRG